MIPRPPGEVPEDPEQGNYILEYLGNSHQLPSVISKKINGMVSIFIRLLHRVKYLCKYGFLNPMRKN